MATIDVFEAARPQMTALAFRMLGSIHDAEDAVQTTWIKAATAAEAHPANPDAWLTTVLTRVCLDQLRKRRRQGDLHSDVLPTGEAAAADEQYIERERVSRALMVVLTRLTPPQRVAYVLHDLFDVPFDLVAEALTTSAQNAKKHASRARAKMGRSALTAPQEVDPSSPVADAFLAAAAGGDIDAMIGLLDPECRRVVNPALVAPGTPTVVRGARAVAHETSQFADRIRAAVAMRVNDRPAYIIAPGGHPLGILDIVVTPDGRVAEIRIEVYTEQTSIAQPRS